MSDTYLINSADLTTKATRIETAQGLQDAPGWRDQDIEIPGAHGLLDIGSDSSTQRRAFGPGSITFQGWVKGVDPATGLWTGDGLDTYFDRVDSLMSMFYARTLNIDHPRTAGLRRAVGRLAAAITPARELSSPWFGRFSAQCVIPGSFWAEIGTVTASATVATGGTLSLATFAPSNAPIADGLITFGPGTNPTLIQGGTFVAYDGVIAAGRQLTVDCGTWSLGIGSGTAWTPLQSALRYSPGPAWFEFDPIAGLTAILTHTAGGTMLVSFSARRRYLTS